MRHNAQILPRKKPALGVRERKPIGVRRCACCAVEELHADELGAGCDGEVGGGGRGGEAKDEDGEEGGEGVCFHHGGDWVRWYVGR